jgi:hypothetical protein
MRLAKTVRLDPHAWELLDQLVVTERERIGKIDAMMVQHVSLATVIERLIRDERRRQLGILTDPNTDGLTADPDRG